MLCYITKTRLCYITKTSLCHSKTTLCHSTTRQTMSLFHQCRVSAQPLFGASAASIVIVNSNVPQPIQQVQMEICSIGDGRIELVIPIEYFCSVSKLQNLCSSIRSFNCNNIFWRKLTQVQKKLEQLWLLGTFGGGGIAVGDFSGTISCRWHDGSIWWSCTNTLVVMVVQWYDGGDGGGDGSR